jgi:hypothetical protein
VVKYGSGEFHVPNPRSYTLVDSLNFPSIEGGFGYLYVLKYDETKGSSVINDPNFQYWRIYVSFLNERTGSPTIPSLVYQTTNKLNNIKLKSCESTYIGEGYLCIMSFNNTITNNQTEASYYQLGFLSSGTFLRLDLISKQVNQTDFELLPLFYGGFLITNYHENTLVDSYILDNEGNYLQPWESFGPGFVHYNMIRKNSTYFGIKKQIGNKLEFVFKPIPKLTNQGKFLVFFLFLFPLFKNNFSLFIGTEYECPIIETTQPAINEVIDPLIEKIMIKYTIPVKLSTGNISIFQLNDDPYKPGLLRQTFSADSKLCTIGSDNRTVYIPIFKSTFNQPNSSYYVVVENNFISSQARNEHLIGIKEKKWIFSISNIHIFLKLLIFH